MSLVTEQDAMRNPRAVSTPEIPPPEANTAGFRKRESEFLLMPSSGMLARVPGKITLLIFIVRTLIRE